MRKLICSLITKFGLITAALVFGFSVLIFAQEKIVIAGTGDSQQILRLLARAFESANPGKKIEVPDSIGSSGGIKSLLEGKCDLARSARPLKPKENSHNLTYKKFAFSPVVFAVSANVKLIDNLTVEQVIGIFSGKINSWDMLGGEKARIYVAMREEGDSSLEIIKDNIPQWKNIETFTGETLYSTPEVVNIIAGHKNTIGFIPIAMADKEKMNVLKLNGILPSVENVRNKSYKLIIPFSIIWKGELNGLAKAFVDFLSSPAAQKIMLENGVVPNN